MRFRRPTPTEVGATPGDPRPANPSASTPVLLVPAAVDADWSVPSGVRKASEWAWRGLVIAAALVAVAGFAIARVPWRPETSLDVGDRPENDTTARSQP